MFLCVVVYSTESNDGERFFVHNLWMNPGDHRWTTGGQLGTTAVDKDVMHNPQVIHNQKSTGSAPALNGAEQEKLGFSTESTTPITTKKDFFRREKTNHQGVENFALRFLVGSVHGIGADALRFDEHIA